MSRELTDIRDAMHQQGDALIASAGLQVSRDSNARDQSVRQLLLRCASLAHGASELCSQSNNVAISVLARAALENLIVLLWALVSDANANSLEEAAHAELVRVARINLERGNTRIINRETGEDETKEFLNSDRFKRGSRRISVELRAKEAGVEDLYNVFYRFMSLDTHGHNLETHAGELDALTMMHMQGLGAVVTATGHAGVRWLLHQERTDNETLRNLLGLES